MSDRRQFVMKQCFRVEIRNGDNQQRLPEPCRRLSTELVSRRFQHHTTIPDPSGAISRANTSHHVS